MTNIAWALGFSVLALVTLGLLFWPESGFFWRWRRGRKAAERVLIEDTLKYLFKCKKGNQHPTLVSVAGMLSVDLDRASQILDITRERELVSLEGDELQLTSKGREMALQIIRAHRLWERYLADSTGFAEGEWHKQAEKVEHHLSSEQLDRLSAKLGRPTHDPHGDPIPSPTGDLEHHGGQPLSTLEEGSLARIVHIEDEPDIFYAQIVAQGIHPQMIVRVGEKTPERVQLWSEGREINLAPMIANNLSALPVEDEEVDETKEGITMDRLERGQRGKVIEISPRMRGLDRRRLLDLGVLPGTEVRAEMVSPSGDPTAYRIRESLIALREEQARQIRVRVGNGHDDEA